MNINWLSTDNIFDESVGLDIFGSHIALYWILIVFAVLAALSLILYLVNLFMKKKPSKNTTESSKIIKKNKDDLEQKRINLEIETIIKERKK